VLSKNKTVNTTQFINVSGKGFFKKDGNINILKDEHINQIMEMFDSKEDITHISKSVNNNVIAQKGYNLSVSTYVEPKDNREQINISELNQEISNTLGRITTLRSDIDRIKNKMVNLSYLKKMSEGVKWTVLGDDDYLEIANNGRKPVKASLRIAGDIPYYGANNVQDYVEGFTHDGEFVLIAEDGTKSVDNYSIQYAVGKFWANNHVHVIRGKSELNTKYLFYYLQTVSFIPFLSGGGRAKLTKGKLVEIPIAFPPIETQNTIVSILDSFEELSTELSTELLNRGKQNEYYRDLLLTFPEESIEV
jgi:restriction endonuclease S subunit